MKICKKCNEKFEGKLTFCTKCGTMLYPYVSSKTTSNKTHSVKEFQYEDWDPPSPETIYRKIKDISHSNFRFEKAKGFYSSELLRIEENLNKKVYCCSTCSYYIRPECYLKNMTVYPKAICKSFELQP
ncbi:MAG TPA: hypothetical protein VFD03_00610 [Clostridia bacterium]|nr:hypothetical protein [Clostridia bacterium]